MASRRSRPLVVVSLAIAGVAALGVSPAMTPTLATGAKTVLADVKLLETEAWVMGFTGTPIPSPGLIADVSALYNPPSPLFDGQPLFTVSATATNPLFTPEGLYPLTGAKSLEFDPSVAQGVSILNTTITSQIADGYNLLVGGGSQSATIASLEMQDLLALPTPQQPTADQLSFVLLGDPSNPDGGLLERFDLPNLPQPVTIPSLGLTFSGATPADTPWETAIYTQEYDGFADFPRYPIDLLADLNAVAGIAYVHPNYPYLSDEQLDSTIQLPVSPDYTGDTQYFMIPTENLPLLEPLRGSPLGNAIADLLQPDLKVLVDLGYGNVDTETDIDDGLGGWDQGPANVPTPLGLFPTNINLGDLVQALWQGAQKGINDFSSDLGSLSTQSTADVGATVAGGAADSLSSLTDFANALSSAVSAAFQALLVTADVINALIITMPADDVTLFVQELNSGSLLDAIGMPIAADFGVVSVAGGFELDAIENALSTIDSAFQDLTPS